MCFAQMWIRQNNNRLITYYECVSYLQRKHKILTFKVRFKNTRISLYNDSRKCLKGDFSQWKIRWEVTKFFTFFILTLLFLFIFFFLNEISLSLSLSLTLSSFFSISSKSLAHLDPSFMQITKLTSDTVSPQKVGLDGPNLLMGKHLLVFKIV